MDLAEGEPHRLVEALMNQAQNFDNARVTTIDGLRVDFEDGWGLVRASNTQPCIVMRFEGVNEQALQSIRKRFDGLILDAAKIAGVPI